MLGRDRVRIHKTKAHRDLAQATSVTEAWEIWHNGVADKVAKTVNFQRTPEFWHLWREHAALSKFLDSLHGEVVALHQSVAKLSIATSSERPLDEIVETARPKRVFTANFHRNGWDGVVPHGVIQEYGVALMHRINVWWLHRTDQVQPHNVQWVTFAHLYVDFQQTWGHAGPIKFGKTWLDPETRPYMEVEKFSFTARLKWFRRLLKVFWQQTKQTVSLATCKGVGDSIQSFIACAAVSWESRCVLNADAWILGHLKKPCLRGAKELTFLPLAAKSNRMALPASAGGVD